MKTLVLPLLAFVVPTVAFGTSAADRVAIAKQLTKEFPGIVVTAESLPVISGDKDPLLFRISPSGKPDYGNLFLKGRYDIIYKPDDKNYGLGSYLCDIASQFVKERRMTQTNFVPKFGFKVGVNYPPISFEISGDETTIKDIAYGVLWLWDHYQNDYGKFNIFIRGYADRGYTFRRPLLRNYPIHKVTFFPLAKPKDPTLAIYSRKFAGRNVADPYTNVDLPNLRATFLKGVMDRFLKECQISTVLTPEAIVLDGAVINMKAPQYRTVDVYFYAYR
jgi:hypothetical protein